MQTGLEAAQEVGRGLKGQLQEAHRDCAALQAALREEEAEAKSLRGSLTEQQAQAAQLETPLKPLRCVCARLCDSYLCVLSACRSRTDKSCGSWG